MGAWTPTGSQQMQSTYGQKEIHRKVMSQNFINCHTKICHVDAHATLNDGMVVQVMGLLSNNNQTLWSNNLEEHLEEPVLEPEPELEPVPDIQEDKPEPPLEEAAPENVQKSTSPAPVDVAPAQEDLRTFSWASVTSKNLPPSGAVLVTGTPSHVVHVPPSQPRSESKPESQNLPQRPQRDQRVREQRINIPPLRGLWSIREAGEAGDVEPRRMMRHPDSHRLFIGNLPHELDKSELKDFFQNYRNVGGAAH
ncbi:hypothetical protein U0070_022413 [Myodes glareolus]|uniref:Nuclear transport factor 2 domain-containing protein n=1 Tax=Myodes glareolus TaxID=447135 RepID=A0AAW0HRF2_MYOGA